MLEGNLKAEDADYEQIRRERQEKAYPILQQMENWMKQTYNSFTPKSPLGKAISYAFGMWLDIPAILTPATGDIDPC